MIHSSSEFDLFDLATDAEAAGKLKLPPAASPPNLLLLHDFELLLRNLFVSRFLEFQIVHVSAGRFQTELFFQNKVLCVSVGYLYNLSLFAKCFDIFQ